MHRPYRPRARAFGAAAAAFALCAALAGCSQGDSAAGEGKVVLHFTWWGNADRAARTEKAVAAFEKAHPDVDIRTSYSPYEAYKQKLATQAAGGDAPDLVQLDYRQISQYAGSGILLDLTEQRKALPTGEMDKSLLKTGQFEGKQYAVPMGVGTQTLAYDKKAWREAGLPLPRPGWTWDELEDALRGLKREHGSPVMTDPGSMEDWFEVYLRSRGKRLYDEKGQVAFNEDDLTAYWAFTSKLRKEGLVSPAEGTTQLDGSVENSPMGRKKAMAEFNWDAPSAGFESVYGDRLALAPMPAGKDGTMGQYFKPNVLIGIAANSPHPREAARFVDFLLNTDEAADILSVDRGTPVNNQQRTRLLPELTGFQKGVAELQKSLQGKLKDPPTAPPRGDNALQSVFQKDYDQVAFEKATPRQVAREFLTEAGAELRP
ncbi:ABC transporter substrate-binding protein [Streptomyces sp. 3N207]|uniref:ABC transporter substrate-binding protein n=1 Tax=Streptomyces sp. 3N207 TaxID=3457417 RepID=UPI003FD568E8